MTGNITNAQAAEKIATELGLNTDNIYVMNTTQLTTLNLTGLNSSSSIRIEDNQNLTNINLSSLTNNFFVLRISNNPMLTSINLNGLNSTFREFSIYGNPILTTLTLPSFTYLSPSVSFTNNSFTSNTINSLLNKFLTVLPASGKNISLSGQNPPAPPIGYRTRYNRQTNFN